MDAFSQPLRRFSRTSLTFTSHSQPTAWLPRPWSRSGSEKKIYTFLLTETKINHIRSFSTSNVIKRHGDFSKNRTSLQKWWKDMKKTWQGSCWETYSNIKIWLFLMTTLSYSLLVYKVRVYTEACSYGSPPERHLSGQLLHPWSTNVVTQYYSPSNYGPCHEGPCHLITTEILYGLMNLGFGFWHPRGFLTSVVWG